MEGQNKKEKERVNQKMEPTNQNKLKKKHMETSGEVRLVWSILLVFPNNMSQDLIQSRIKTQFVFISSWLRSIP